MHYLVRNLPRSAAMYIRIQIGTPPLPANSPLGQAICLDCWRMIAVWWYLLIVRANIPPTLSFFPEVGWLMAPSNPMGHVFYIDPSALIWDLTLAPNTRMPFIHRDQRLPRPPHCFPHDHRDFINGTPLSMNTQSEQPHNAVISDPTNPCLETLLEELTDNPEGYYKYVWIPVNLSTGRQVHQAMGCHLPIIYLTPEHQAAPFIEMHAAATQKVLKGRLSLITKSKHLSLLHTYRYWHWFQITLCPTSSPSTAPLIFLFPASLLGFRPAFLTPSQTPTAIRSPSPFTRLAGTLWPTMVALPPGVRDDTCEICLREYRFGLISLFRQYCSNAHGRQFMNRTLPFLPSRNALI